MTEFKSFRDLIPGELIMVRIFGLLIALVASVQTANAALLASWNFNTDTSGTVAAGIEGSATNMVNFGPTAAVNSVTYGNNGFRFATGNHWRTSQFNVQGANNVLAARGSSLSFTNLDECGPIKLSSLSFNAKNQAGTAQRGVRVSVSINGGAEQAIGDYVRTSTAFSTSTGSLDGLVLRKDDTLQVFFRFFKDEANVTQRQLDIDDIEINGEVVPEPASLAVFGLVGAGVAFARRRKK
jgi:PEP-CTERM motif